MDITLFNPYENYKIVETYKTNETTISIYDVEDVIEKMYNISIGEYKLNIKDLKNIYEDVLEYDKTGDTLNPIIKRWYKQFGILQYLMKDDSILEININPPAYKTPIRVIHEKYGECITNIYTNKNFIDYFLTRLKMQSGRPLNKVSPELDTEIEISGIKARIAVVTDPFSIFGAGFSIRKHRENPWTFELFIKNRTLNPLFAGFMNLVISKGRSYIFAGPRGSGKTSLMTSSLLEIPTIDRIITIEDTQEIPIKTFQRLGYDMLSLKVRSALMDEGMEVDFEKGLRTTLRLGDSCLILGEIRSKEAKVLYEAMRVGAMSNVVTGTIHADTPYGVYDRVVNDLGVTKGSFKVTDLIIIVNLIKDASGNHKLRRIVEVSEVLKDWENEPQFQTLFKYNTKTDELEPTEILLGGKSILLKEFLKNTRNYQDYNDILTDMYFRTKAKEIVINNIKNKDHLEAIHTKIMNTEFLKYSEQVQNFKDVNKLKEILNRYEIYVKKYGNK